MSVATGTHMHWCPVPVATEIGLLVAAFIKQPRMTQKKSEEKRLVFDHPNDHPHAVLW